MSSVKEFFNNHRQLFYSLGAVAIMAVIALAFFYPDATEGRVLQQNDMTQGMANGQEVKQYAEQTGHTSRWTNSLFGGMPNFQIAPSYKSAPMLEWIGKVYSLGLPSPANLLFIMMLGFFIMGMCMKMRWYVSLFGAIAWGFSTYFIIIIGAGHIWKFVTLAYIPPTIGGIILCYRGKYLGGAALAALFGALQLLSNHIQMTYYFLFVVAAIMIGFLFMAIRNKRMKPWLIATASLVGAAALAFGANCASLLNTAKYTKETIRGKATEIVDPQAPKSTDGADFDYITAWSYGGDELFTFMVPNVKGGATIKPEAGSNVPKDFSERTDGAIQKLDYESQDYLKQLQWQNGLFREYFGNQPMTNGPVYVGVFLLYLAIIGCFLWKGPMKWCIIIVTVLSVLLALGHNFAWLSHLFIDWFPLYGRFRTVSSILVIAEFTLPLLAMMALAKIIAEPDFLKHHKKVIVITGSVMAFLCLLLVAFPSMLGEGFSSVERQAIDENNLYQDPALAAILNAVKADRLAMVRADALRSLLFLGFGMLFLWMYGKRTIRSASVFMAAMILLLLIDLFSVNKRYLDSASFTEPLPAEEVMDMTDADREILRDTAMNYRVARIDNLGDSRTSYFHKSVGGYHAAKLTRYNDLLEHQLMQGNIEVFNMLNTRYFMAQQPDESGNPQMIVEQNPDAYGNAWFVDRVKVVDNANAEMEALSDTTVNLRRTAVTTKDFVSKLGKTSALAPGDTIFETSYAPDRLTYHASSRNGGVAVFSEVFFPWGWHATIDGKPAEISRVNYVLRAMKIPAGNHTVEMWFDPETLNTTNTLSVISVWVIYLLCLGGLGMGVAALCPSLLCKRGKGVKKTSEPEKTKEAGKQ